MGCTPGDWDGAHTAAPAPTVTLHRPSPGQEDNLEGEGQLCPFRAHELGAVLPELPVAGNACSSYGLEEACPQWEKTSQQMGGELSGEEKERQSCLPSWVHGSLKPFDPILPS